VFANRYTVFVDACSLAGVLKRDILLSLAEAEFFRVQWSAEVLGETERALAEMFTKRGNPDPTSIASTQCQRIQDAFPEAMVSGYGAYMTIAGGLPDPKDTHVLAAALKGQASTIVTDNVRDFPESVLMQFGIEAKTTDDFIADTIELDIGKAVAVIRSLRERYKNPSLTADDLLLKMEAVGLTETVDILRPHLDSL
jgi:hypothetical protein